MGWFSRVLGGLTGGDKAGEQPEIDDTQIYRDIIVGGWRANVTTAPGDPEPSFVGCTARVTSGPDIRIDLQLFDDGNVDVLIEDPNWKGSKDSSDPPRLSFGDHVLAPQGTSWVSDGFVHATFPVPVMTDTALRDETILTVAWQGTQIDYDLSGWVQVVAWALDSAKAMGDPAVDAAHGGMEQDSNFKGGFYIPFSADIEDLRFDAPPQDVLDTIPIFMMWRGRQARGVAVHMEPDPSRYRDPQHVLNMTGLITVSFLSPWFNGCRDLEVTDMYEPRTVQGLILDESLLACETDEGPADVVFLAVSSDSSSFATITLVQRDRGVDLDALIDQITKPMVLLKAR